MAFTETINDLSHTDRTSHPLKLCPATWVWIFCGDIAGLAVWEFLAHHVCVCVFYGFGTAGRNEELISESSGKHSKRGRRSEERLSVLVRIKTRGSLSTSLLLRAAWERGLLIRTLIPDTPSACSVNYQAKYFVIHCAPLTAPASCFHTYTVSKMNLCQMLNAS